MIRVLRKQIATMALVTAVASFATVSANAQTAQTGQASPGRVQGQFKTPDFVPGVSPKVEVKELKIDGAPDNADSIKFNLVGITLDDVSVYSQSELQKVYQSKLGTTVTLAELYGIAADLTRKYRNDGYILTRVVVPPQTIESGIARLRVVEGFVNKIEVRANGESARSKDLISDYASMISHSGPLNVKDLERGLLLINDLPGVSARSVLSPSEGQVGGADLLIIVERKSYDAQIGVDNYGTRFLGPVQTHASGAANSWIGLNEQIGAQLFMAHDDDEFTELLYGSLSYTQPIGPYGTKLSFFGSNVHTEPGFSLDQFKVNGKTQNFNIKATHPFVRSRTLNLNGFLSFDWMDLDSKDNLGGNTVEDRIRKVVVGGDFEALDTFFGGLAFNNMRLKLSRGLDIFGSNGEGDSDVTRPAFKPDFYKIEAELQRLQRITRDVNVLVAVQGQMTSSPVLSSEEFGVGGINYGRGYDSSEIIGDEGVAGKLEVQWRDPYDVPLLDTYQVYGFFDAGVIWNDDAANKLQRDTVTSTGMGVRANFNPDLTGDLLVALPLNRTPQTRNNQGARFFFGLNKDF